MGSTYGGVTELVMGPTKGGSQNCSWVLLLGMGFTELVMGPTDGGCYITGHGSY